MKNQNLPAMVRTLTLLGILSVLVFVSCNKPKCAQRNEVIENYAVIDSTVGPPDIDSYFYREYEVQVVYCDGRAKDISIENLGRRDFILYGEMDGNCFDLPQVEFEDEWVVRARADGTLQNDTLLFNYYYLNKYGEPYATKGIGIKIH